MSIDRNELTEEDVSTVAACVAFLGTHHEIADNVSQALLDATESLNTGLCVRCRSDIGKGPASCLICQGVRNVQTLKLVKENSPEETLKEQLEAGWTGWGEDKTPELDDVDQLEPGARGPVTLEPIRMPWTEKELNKLNMNSHLPVKTLDWLFKDRTPEEIQEKLEELQP